MAIKFSLNDCKTLIKVQKRMSRLYRYGEDSEKVRELCSVVCASIEELFEQLIRENSENE